MAEYEDLAALRTAIKEGDAKAVATALQKYPALRSAVFEDGSTPLIEAVRRENTQVIDALLKDVSPQEKLALLQPTDSNSPQTSRSSIHRFGMIELNRMTPLHYAASTKNPEILDKLVEGLTPEQTFNLLQLKDFIDDTPLHIAAQYKNTYFIQHVTRDLDDDQKKTLQKTTNIAEQNYETKGKVSNSSTETLPPFADDAPKSPSASETPKASPELSKETSQAPAASSGSTTEQVKISSFSPPAARASTAVNPATSIPIDLFEDDLTRPIKSSSKAGVGDNTPQPSTEQTPKEIHKEADELLAMGRSLLNKTPKAANVPPAPAAHAKNEAPADLSPQAQAMIAEAKQQSGISNKIASGISVAANLLRQMDRDGDGVVSLAEVQKTGRDTLQRVFGSMSSPEEFRAALIASGLDYNDKRVGGIEKAIQTAGQMFTACGVKFSGEKDGKPAHGLTHAHKSPYIHTSIT